MSVQWGPWKEVGMAAQKGTVERLRASGVGSLTNAFGMAALAGCLQSLPANYMAMAAVCNEVPPLLPHCDSLERIALATLRSVL